MATSCSNMSRRQITPYEQVGLIVAATRWGDTSQRQIASCVQEKFCKNLCLRNRILSLQQVAKNQIRLNLCDLLRRQNSFPATKIFTKILQYARSDLSLLMCHRDVLVQLVALKCVPTTRLSSFSTPDKKYRECTDTMQGRIQDFFRGGGGVHSSLALLQHQ